MSVMAIYQARRFKRLMYIFRGIVKASNASKNRDRLSLFFRASQPNE